MKNTMKKTRGFVDPITLGFLLSFFGTTTALTTRDVNQVEPTQTAAQTQVQAVATIETENDFDF
ncbi:hypothetical protein MNBD_GAMMA22-2930 [hydrothermal vent metagenome]|uniref:Uncharacterized protein n=1 Tax=hydrothermal vent metagenome TaxID=652676 RepID=A0A3B1ANH8_9ZZZZ